MSHPAFCEKQGKCGAVGFCYRINVYNLRRDMAISVGFKGPFGLTESVDRPIAARRRFVFFAMARKAAVGRVTSQRVVLKHAIPMFGSPSELGIMMRKIGHSAECSCPKGAFITRPTIAALLGLFYMAVASTASADPGFQAHAVLRQGGVLIWSFDANGAIASRTIDWPDATSKGELYSPSGNYEGMTVTKYTGTGSFITRRCNVAGLETGYSIVTPASPRGMIGLNRPLVSTQYGAQGGGGHAAAVGRSVKIITTNPDGSFVTTTKRYTIARGTSMEELAGTTVTQTRGSRAVSTDYASTGKVLASRILVANSDKSSTLTSLDDRGRVLGSARLSMNIDGTVVLKSYDPVGHLLSLKSLTTAGTMTDTSYQSGRIAGRSVWIPTAVGGNVTTYFSAGGTKIGDWWVSPDGTYGSDTPSPNGASTGIEHYRDSSWSRTENNGRGQIIVTYYSSKGARMGAAKMDVDASGVTSLYASTDGTVRTQMLVDRNGSVRAMVDRPGGRSIGFSLTPEGNFSRLVADIGTTRAYNFDGNGLFVGVGRKGNASADAAGKVVVQPDPEGQVTIEDLYSNDAMSRYELARQDASGSIRIAAYDPEGYAQESIALNASGVIEQTLGITSSGVVTTTWKADGSYRQTTDDGEGNATTTNYSVDGRALSD